MIKERGLCSTSELMHPQVTLRGRGQDVGFSGAGNEGKLTRKRGKRPFPDITKIGVGSLQWLEDADRPGGQLLDDKQSRNRSRYIQLSLKQYPYLVREAGGKGVEIVWV